MCLLASGVDPYLDTAASPWFNGPMTTTQTPNWQSEHPNECCACGVQMNDVTPTSRPICAECYDLINGDDDDA